MVYRLSKVLNLLDQALKTLKIGKEVFVTRDRRLDEGDIQWWEHIWDKITGLKVCYKKALGQVMSALYKELQSLRSKASYGTGRYNWYTNNIFERVEEES